MQGVEYGSVQMVCNNISEGVLVKKWQGSAFVVWAEDRCLILCHSWASETTYSFEQKSFDMSYYTSQSCQIAGQCYLFEYSKLHRIQEPY